MRPVPPSPHLTYEIELPANYAGSIKISPRLAGRYDDATAEGLWSAFYGALDRLNGDWYVEHEHNWRAYLSPCLTDPASLSLRAAVASAALDALLGTPAAGNELALVDWAVVPLLHGIETRWSATRRAGGKVSLGQVAVDFESLRAARGPLLGRYLGGALPLSDLETFREVHHRADPLAAFALAALAQPGGNWNLSSVGYAVAPPLDGILASLEQRRLARPVGSSPYRYLERTPRLARLLSAAEAMALPCGGRL